jgi:Mce-associated membrane protein
MTHLRSRSAVDDHSADTEKESTTVRVTTTHIPDLDEPEGTDTTLGDHAGLIESGAENTYTADILSGNDSDAGPQSHNAAPASSKARINWLRVLVFGVLPALVLVLALAAGFFKWQDASTRSAQVARIESVAAAKDATIALLSYQPDTVDRDLGAARTRLTGTFKESYIQLTRDVVIPGAKQQHISAVATVPAAASVSASPSHAVALLFVNQTTIVGADPPTATASSVRVTLDKIDGHWLVSGFDPV